METTQPTNTNIDRKQVETLIQLGQKKGLTGKDVIDALVRKGYTPEGVDVQGIKSSFVKEPTPVQEKAGFGQRVAEDFSQRREKLSTINNSDFTTGSKILQNVGQVAGGVGDILWEGVKSLTPDTVEKKIGDTVAKGAQKVMENPKAQEIKSKISDWAKAHPEAVGNLEAVLNIASIIPELKGFEVGGKALQTGTKVAADAIETGAKVLAEGAVEVGSKILPKSEEIMNRVARLTPNETTTFTKIAGKTPGEYLAETGNFSKPEDIITKEAEKFSQSLADKKDALAKLPGVYKDGSLSDALDMLIEKAKKESGTNVKSPYLDQVVSLKDKLDNTGLTMQEAENVKSLLEKNVKLGYNKLTNAEKVQQATNIDNALRKWQSNKASELGFTNISDINKQTQISKFIVDKLGKQIIGKSGLNGVSLTDWIMLSGGNPAAVSGFLTKKFFSSKSVQAKIAELLSSGEIKGQIRAKLEDLTSKNATK